MNVKHNMRHSVEYRAWTALKQRCTDENHSSYESCKGQLSKEWFSFDKFFLDMGLKTDSRDCLVRLNSDFPYSKHNCIWGTRKQVREYRRLDKKVALKRENNKSSQNNDTIYFELERRFEMKEIWKKVPGYEDLYKVSNKGRLFSLRRNKKMNPSQHKTKGYLRTFLRKNNVSKYFEIHRIVALSFFGPSNGLQVNHKNRIKTDNRVENLEYVTALENVRHSYKVGKRDIRNGERINTNKLTEKEVVKIKKELKQGKTHVFLGNKYGVHSSTIGHISSNRNWKHLKG